MTKYHTADGHEIVRDGVYITCFNDKFTCIRITPTHQDYPIWGYIIDHDGKEYVACCRPDQLTLWREPAKPEQVEVWEVVYRNDVNEIGYSHFVTQHAAEKYGKSVKAYTIRLKETITVGGV